MAKVHDPNEAWRTKPDTTNLIQSAMATKTSNVYGLIRGADGWLFGSLNVVRRGNQDWLAVCKVTMLPELTPWVAFGAGRDYERALEGLNASVAANKWKPDKPWKAKR